MTLMFNCLEDLNKKCEDIPESLKETSSTAANRSIQILLTSARDSIRKKDLEKAYIFYGRCFTLIKLFKSHQPHFKMKNSDGKEIIERMTVISDKLSLLYQENKKKQLKEQDREKKEDLKCEENASEEYINHEELDYLLNQKSKSLLIIDVRSTEDFKKHQINYSKVLNLPRSVLQPGNTSGTLKNKIPVESRDLWSRKDKFDTFIILDKNGEITESSIKLLKSAISEEEPFKLLILEGGFLTFSENYPSKIKSFQPLSKRPEPPKVIQTPITDLDLEIKEVSYPSCDVAFIKTPSPKPAFTSGAITIQSKPEIPSRATKPKLEVSDSSMNKGFMESKSSEETILENLAEESLAKTRKILSLEEEHENLRVQREKKAEEWAKFQLLRGKEAEEAKNRELLKNEEALIAKLLQAEKNIQETEEENQALRSRIQLMQSNVNVVLQSIARKRLEEKLSDVEIERKKLYESVKIKRLHRKEIEKKKAQLEIDKKRSENLDQKIESKENRGLSRSTSSPNIVKLMKDELQAPRVLVDRSNKPGPSPIRRNFEQVWTSGREKKGLTGLKNLGNTCYMNAVLQCISNFTVMAKYFLENNFKKDLNKFSETKGEIATEYAALLQELWSGMSKSVAPYDIKRAIGRHSVSFKGTDQQDAHEFLVTFMLWIHNDLNEIKSKVPLPEQENSPNTPVNVSAKKAWDSEQTIDKSFIRQIFYGQRRSTLQCETCGFASVRFESFFELSLELPPGNGRVSLLECLRLYLKPVTVTWKCPECKRDREASKKFDLVKLPLILTIQIVRFYNDGFWRKKLNAVDFDLNKVNFGEFVSTFGDEGNALNYYKDFSLYGVCNHFGSMEGGHYTAYCYSQVYSKWYKYDDQDVHEIDKRNVVTPAAYILFYAAKN